MEQRICVRNPDVLNLIQELRSTSDPAEAGRLLSSGTWIAIYAVHPDSNDSIEWEYLLGRVEDKTDVILAGLEELFARDHKK